MDEEKLKIDVFNEGIKLLIEFIFDEKFDLSAVFITDASSEGTE